MDISKLNTDRINQDRAAETQKSKQAQVKVSTDKGAENKATEQAQSSSAANVQWSSNALRANEALAIAKNAPDVRADRVAELKAAIANGTYKTDSKAIAEKMISSSLEDDLLTRNG